MRRHLAFTRGSIHRVELLLKRFVEEHVPLGTQEREEPSGPLQTAKNEPLLLAQFFTRRPARCSHKSYWRSRYARSPVQEIMSSSPCRSSRFGPPTAAHVAHAPSDRNHCGIESIGALDAE